MKYPLQYYQNVTVNTVHLLECMGESGVDKVRGQQAGSPAACRGRGVRRCACMCVLYPPGHF